MPRRGLGDVVRMLGIAAWRYLTFSYLGGVEMTVRRCMAATVELTLFGIENMIPVYHRMNSIIWSALNNHAPDIVRYFLPGWKAVMIKSHNYSDIYTSNPSSLCSRSSEFGVQGQFIAFSFEEMEKL
jgi:hypothetical protein